MLARFLNLGPGTSKINVSTFADKDYANIFLGSRGVKGYAFRFLFAHTGAEYTTEFSCYMCLYLLNERPREMEPHSRDSDCLDRNQLFGSISPSDLRINELGEGLSSNMAILSEGASG